MTPDEGTADSGFDMNAAVDAIGADLGLGLDDEAPIEESTVKDEEQDADPKPAEVVKDPSQEAPQVKPPPKSWAKDKHEIWSKLPPDAQDYYEQREKQMLDGLEQYKGDATYAKQLRDIITPYEPMLRAQGINQTEAIQYLMNAHYRLTNGSMEERQQVYRQLGEQLGFVQQQAANAQPVDPTVAALQREVLQLKSGREAELRAAQQREHESNVKQIETFAADPANVYFNEVANDMLPLVQAGMKLDEAYKKAVWANEVTRAKELSRIQTEAEERRKAEGVTKLETARKTASANVRSQETRKAPTDPKGDTWEETMRDVLRKRSERV